MWRVIKGTGVDFVAKDLAPYEVRLSRNPTQAPNFAAFATVSRPTIPVTEKDVKLSLDRDGSTLASSEFQALFEAFTKGTSSWHLDHLSEAKLPMARFQGLRLVTIMQLPAVIATVINSEPFVLGDGVLSISNDPGSGHHFVRETRVSEIRIAVSALVPGPEPKRVLLWAQSARFRERMRFMLEPGQKLEDYYPPPKYFDDQGHSVAAVMSTLIEGASLLVS